VALVNTLERILSEQHTLAMLLYIAFKGEQLNAKNIKDGSSQLPTLV